MKRLTERQYQRRASATMVLYVVAMLVVWPLAKGAPQLWLKALLTLVPALPMLYVIALLARRIADSDELEQRTHLVALGVATGLTGALSLVAGLLAASGAVTLDGTVLIWVFPLMTMVYGITRWWVMTRRYGGSMACDGSAGWWEMPSRLLLAAALLALVVLVVWWRGRLDAFNAGALSGMIVSLVGLAALSAWRGWRRRALTRAGGAEE
jgi:hypothetical protein